MLGDRTHLVLIAVNLLAFFLPWPQVFVVQRFATAPDTYWNMEDLGSASCDENATIAWTVVDSLCNVY